MATSLSGHPAPSLPTDGEMVGVGARRKRVCHPALPCRNGLDYKACDARTVESDSSFADSDTPTMNIGTAGSFHNHVRRQRKHVYDEIKITSSDCGAQFKVVDVANDCAKPKSVSHSCVNRNGKKPELPPKPKFVLRDKRQRHVYQTIALPGGLEDHPVPPPPPPLPNKPVCITRLKNQTGDVPPPLPPRVANKEAIKQRHKLDKEYFENLRKSVDETLLEIAEEGDLPVRLPLADESISADIPETLQSNFNRSIRVGSPESSVSSAYVEPPNRRHSLPHPGPEGSRNAGNGIFAPIPFLPARSSSLDDEAELDKANAIPDSNDFISNSTQSPHVLLTQNLKLLKKCGWYWGNMTWQEAEDLLASKGEGAFLMRDSQNPNHLLTVTARSGNNTIHHIRVAYLEGKFQLYEPGRTVSRSAEQCVRHSNIKQFIKLAMKHSTSGSFLYFVKPKNMGEPPIQIRLLTPVSRFTKVKSLQYGCRMVIRNCIVADSMDNIHVPHRIRDYLLAGPYYDAKEEL